MWRGGASRAVTADHFASATFPALLVAAALSLSLCNTAAAAMSSGPGAQHAEFVRRATDILRASADGVTARDVRTRMEADMGLPPNAPLERYNASRPARHIEMLVSKCGMHAGARSSIVGESGAGV